MARTQQRMRIEQLEERALEELGLDAEALVADYGPDQLVPPVLTAEQVARRGGRGRGAARAGAVRPRGAAEAAARPPSGRWRMLGRVNPLALEEFSALEERHKFLTEQLEDLKKHPHATCSTSSARSTSGSSRSSPRPTPTSSAAFDGVFARLFPGGEGRLVLTDPDDMLTTGIEVEARPPGKKVKRLSLLSGGERSLVAVAFLVALFKARPSPFYILDEVEAALDDTNLGRLLEIYEELRENSPAARDHPPEADDGGRRRALRRHHARRRRLRGDQPAAPRGRAARDGPA